MRQSKDLQLKDFISDAIEKAGFNYELTEYNSDYITGKVENGCDWYRTTNCRYMIFRMHNHDEMGVNLYVVDAKRMSCLHEPLAPQHGNVVFQGKVDTSVKVDIVLKLIGYKNA